jgi:hypothetical protein
VVYICGTQPGHTATCQYNQPKIITPHNENDKSLFILLLEYASISCTCYVNDQKTRKRNENYENKQKQVHQIQSLPESHHISTYPTSPKNHPQKPRKKKNESP